MRFQKIIVSFKLCRSIRSIVCMIDYVSKKKKKSTVHTERRDFMTALNTAAVDGTIV